MDRAMRRSHPTAVSSGSGSGALRKYRVDCLVVDSVTGSVNAQFRFTARQFGRLLERFAAAIDLQTQGTKDSSSPASAPDGQQATSSAKMCSVCKLGRADLVLSCQHALCADCMTNWYKTTCVMGSHFNLITRYLTRALLVCSFYKNSKWAGDSLAAETPAAHTAVECSSSTPSI